MAEVKFGYGSVEKRDGIYGFAIAGETGLRSGFPVKINAEGRYVVVSSADDKIEGFSYWGLYQLPTTNGLVKTDKYEISESGTIVRTVDYSFDAYREGEAFNLIKNGYEDVIVSADVSAGDDVYFDLTNHLYTNVSTNNIKIGNSKFEKNANNGDVVKVYLSI